MFSPFSRVRLFMAPVFDVKTTGTSIAIVAVSPAPGGPVPGDQKLGTNQPQPNWPQVGCIQL
jgi:hypothetical protein